MTGRELRWIESGVGTAPKVAWTATTDAELAGLALSRETGEIVAADVSGGLYIFDRHGRIVNVTRAWREILELAWSDTGNGGIVLVEDNTVCRLNHSLEQLWKKRAPREITALAISPWGHHVAVGIAGRRFAVLDWNGKRVADVETIRTPAILRFADTRPLIVGASKDGQLYCHNLNGSPVWSEKVWSNVGDLSLSGALHRIAVAGYNHGIQILDEKGVHQGSYVVEGTPGLVSMSCLPERIAAATQENHLYWLDADGELIWATVMDESPLRVICDPLAAGMVCGFPSGRIVRLSWELPA